MTLIKPSLIFKFVERRKIVQNLFLIYFVFDATKMNSI